MSENPKISWLMDLIRPYTFSSVILVAFLLLAAVGETIGLSAIVPVLAIIFNGEVGDQGLAKFFLPFISYFPQIDPLAVVLGGFLALILLKSVLQIYSRHLTSVLCWDMSEDWANQLLQKYLAAPFSFLVGAKQGILLHTTVTETYNAAKAVGICIEFFSKVILCFFLYGALLYTNWQATLVLSVFASFAILAFKLISKFRGKSISKENLELQKEQSALAAESFSTVRLLKTFSLEPEMYNRFAKINRRLNEIRVRHDFYNTLPAPVGEVFLVLGICLGLGLVHTFGSGDIKTYLPLIGMIVVVARQLLNSVSMLVSNWVRIQFFLPTMYGVRNALVHTLEEGHTDQGETFTTLKDDIKFSSVHFSYEGGREVLKNAELTFPKGRMTAIIGPSGIGKSTVGDLVLGLIRPQSGHILVNGKPLDSYSRTSWRKKIGYVSQDTIVFHASILDNITCFDSSISLDEVVNATKAAQIHDMIQALPDGYQTIVGERGMKLSGGQRQRLAIARAIVRKPEIYVFDEPTSALDLESEKLVQESIDGFLDGKKTVILITHRQSAIKAASLVYDFGKLLPQQTS